ncbi:MAG TPA: histidine kinase dimerization/phospho-acceptor domain-containing protein, partial [Rhizomicrobium sp.]|nr:histidine kinase dimerization/phospho-acceptor domain-containing protein [Rhizomicrobium sp.]
MRTHALARQALIATLTFGGFFLLGYGGIFIWGGNSHSSCPIWPATAFGFVMLIRLSRSRGDDAALLSAMLAAGLIANRLGGEAPLLALGFSLINMLDVLAGLVAFRRLRLSRVTSAATMARFAFVAGVSPSLFGAVLAAGLVSLQGGDPAFSGTQWFMANLLGACILYPFGLTVSLRQCAKLKLERRFLEALGLFAGLAITATLAFRYGYPAMFLVLVISIAIAARFRLLGAGAALMMVSAFAFASVRTLPQAHTVAWIEILQFYLATISVVSVRTAMLLNERDLHIAIIERRHRRAVRASRFKSQLLAHVSHEVRSPLSAIIGFSAMLESGSLSAERAPEFAAIIAHNGELLQRLHDDLLDLSRAEAGALSIQSERVAVGSTLQACVLAIRLDATLGGKDVLIERVEDALAVKADPIRLAQILNNLIANAFKYGDNYSPIRVRARRLEDGFGRIEIVNAGPGIPPAERQAVFMPFRRSEQVGRR